MQKLRFFLHLVRWPNLIFVVLTQVLFYFFVVQQVFEGHPELMRLSPTYFFVLVFASVCITAAGYIINDYFDVNIDLVNKPNTIILGKHISKRTAIAWHFGLSLVGVVLSFWLSIAMKQKFWWLGFANFGVAMSLVWYSTTLKRKLLVGNVLVSILTAWVVVVIIFSLFQLQQFTGAVDATGQYKALFSKLLRIGMLYAVFAFIISIIREVVKDMEDYLGDIKYGCKTVPIVWGFSIAKVFVGISTIALIVLLLVLQFYVLQFSWYGAIIYCLLFIVAPLLFSMKLLLAAQNHLHYHMLSSLYKIVMLTGILSMIFFKVYA